MMRLSLLVVVPCLMLGATAVAREPAGPETQQRAAEELEIVGQVLADHDVAVVVDWIRKQRRGKITVEVAGQLRPSLGPPNQKYVTPASVVYDLHQIEVEPEDFAEAIARLQPVAHEPMAIGQKDLGRSTGAPAGSSGKAASGDGAECEKIAWRRAAEVAADKGCAGPVVADVDAVEEDRFVATGSCRDTATDEQRDFEVVIQCRGKPFPGKLWVEGSAEPVTRTHESWPVSFRFVGRE